MIGKKRSAEARLWGNIDYDKLLHGGVDHPVVITCRSELFKSLKSMLHKRAISRQGHGTENILQCCWWRRTVGTIRTVYLSLGVPIMLKRWYALSCVLCLISASLGLLSSSCFDSWTFMALSDFFLSRGLFLPDSLSCRQAHVMNGGNN